MVRCTEGVSSLWPGSAYEGCPDVAHILEAVSVTGMMTLVTVVMMAPLTTLMIILLTALMTSREHVQKCYT